MGVEFKDLPNRTTPISATNLNRIQTDLQTNIDNNIPLGAIFEYAGATAPTKWLLCQGQAISRTTYADLFAVIGTRYGAGDGATTFNLPDKRSNVGVGLDSRDTKFNTLGKKYGEKTHKLVYDELPVLQHYQPSVNTYNYESLRSLEF